MIRYGRMKMSHLIADSSAELLEMADRIGVRRRWLQHAGCHTEHLDICASKRRLAIEAGAVPVSSRELGLKLVEKRRRMADLRARLAPGRAGKGAIVGL